MLLSIHSISIFSVINTYKNKFCLPFYSSITTQSIYEKLHTFAGKVHFYRWLLFDIEKVEDYAL